MATVPTESGSLLQRWWSAAAAAAARGGHVPEACRPQQEALVRARGRTLAVVIALLTLLWIPIDALGLEAAEFARVLPLRLALALALLHLARVGERLPAGRVLLVLVGLQALGYAALQLCLEPGRHDALRVGYSLFPFLLAAQLAVFPLPWRPSLWHGLAALLPLFAPLLGKAPPAAAALFDDLWLLGALLALAAWASQAQLDLLAELLAARRDPARDALTGLPNRHSAEQRLEAERQRALREQRPLTVLRIGLPPFTAISARHGHGAADLLLLELAQALRTVLRSADTGARWDQAEFLAILPATDPTQAQSAVARIRARFEQLSIALPEGRIQAPPASFGAATLAADDSTAALLARAEAALQQAEAQGGGRSVAG